MRKNQFKIDELKFLNEFFDGEMCVCGGIADFFYTGYDNITDIDILVTKSAFLSSMQLDFLDSSLTIKKYDFDIAYIKDSFFRELAPHDFFYTGNYKNFPIDIFLVIQLTSNIFLPQYNTKKYGINVASINDRIKKLTTTLNTTKNNAVPESSIRWLKKKQQQAKTKLELYKKLYPKIYDTFYC